MMRLIKNEIFKILHKKGILIVLIITILFMGLVSFLMRQDLNYFDNTIIFDSGSSSDKELNDMYKDYTIDDWQYYVNEDMSSVVSNYYDAKENNYLTKDIENEYKEYKEALTSDNWKFFVNKKIDKEKASLKQYELALKETSSDNDKNDINQQIFVSKVTIEMLEYRLKEGVAFGNDYLNIAINGVINNAYAVKSLEYGVSKDEKDGTEESVKDYYKNRYILENKEDINNGSDLYYLITNFYENYIFLVLVFGIMIAGSIVSEEYNKGTIKSLLITPYKRSSILLAKFITVILLTLVYIVLAYILQIIIGGLLLGLGSLGNSYVTYNLTTNSLVVMNVFKYALLNTISVLPTIILLVTLAFAASTIVGSTALSIVIAFAGVIGASIVNTFALIYKIDILKYFITTNWDLNYYLFGGTSPYGTSLTHAIIVCIVYLLIMVVTSFVVFKKKNIKNI